MTPWLAWIARARRRPPGEQHPAAFSGPAVLAALARHPVGLPVQRGRRGEAAAEVHGDGRRVPPGLHGARRLLRVVPAGPERTCTFDGRSASASSCWCGAGSPSGSPVALVHAVADRSRRVLPEPSWMRVLSQYDRPHVVNVVLAADLGKRWRAGARVHGLLGAAVLDDDGHRGPPDAREPPFVQAGPAPGEEVAGPRRAR